jgi:hypothetical protein
LVDVIYNQTNTGADTTVPVIPLDILVPLTTLGNNTDSFTVLQILEIGLNYVHETFHSAYLRHVYNNAVAKHFVGGEFLGTNRTIPIEDRVGITVKRV